MNIAIVLGGLSILVGLAVLIGHLDARARSAAWRRIATARREVQERELALLSHPEAAATPSRQVPRRQGVRRRDRRRTVGRRRIDH
jgi:hypothetical protein